MGLAELEELLSKPKRNVCRVEGCARPRHQTKRLCVGHLARKQKGKTVEGALRPWQREGAPRSPCGVGGCARPVLIHGRRLCAPHYRRLLKGKPVEGPIAERRSVRMVTAYIRLGPAASEVLDTRAKSLRISRSALARRLIEDWAKAFEGEG